MLLTNKNGKKMLSDTAYSVGKKLAQVILPAISTLYFALAGIWGLPSPEKVIGTIAALTTFLGVSLHVSSNQYDASGAAFDGTVQVTHTSDGSKVNFNVAPIDLASKDAVTFKVQPPVVESLPVSPPTP